MTTYCNDNKPKYVIYVEKSDRIPQHYHKELADAIKEAMRLAELVKKKAYIIEYYIAPKILGYINTDLSMVQFDE